MSSNTWHQLTPLYATFFGEMGATFAMVFRGPYFLHCPYMEACYIPFYMHSIIRAASVVYYVVYYYIINVVILVLYVPSINRQKQLLTTRNSALRYKLHCLK